MKPSLRFAIVGAGTIGGVHAQLIEALGDEAALVAVVDAKVDRAQALASQYGGQAYASAAEAYAAEELDAVSICVPSALHAEAAIEALDAGKHVIVEKPVDITLDAADRLIEAQLKSGRTVTVISQRRFQPPVVEIKSAVERGSLGRITSGIAESAFFRPQSYYDGDDWRGTLAMDGGGALMNQGIHALDLLVWMLGRPVQVSAQTGQLAHQNLEVEDLACATIVFESGAIGLLLASTAAYPGRPVRLTIHGSQGTAILDNDELTYLATTADTEATPVIHSPGAPATPSPDSQAALSSAAPASVAAAPVSQEPSIEPAGRGAAQVEPAGRGAAQVEPAGWGAVQLAHLAQYRDFIASVREGHSPAVSLEAGRRSLATVLAVYESARLGRPVALQDV
ncbi:Gfo/Idh/MocA family oxidoreductase [Kribbella sp. NPDC026611]|uniref:Gfo/Idh/MocA family oxidoreductase n=1 Tax=Kribbella sp. NPDC026611 TaxID=3154911 RepID=UPI0033D7C290